MVTAEVVELRINRNGEINIVSGNNQIDTLVVDTNTSVSILDDVAERINKIEKTQPSSESNIVLPRNEIIKLMKKSGIVLGKASNAWKPENHNTI